MKEENQPLYSKILTHLRDKIMSGELAPRAQLPTELDLAQQFNVSRITSKRALVELEREGLIERKRGSGSFVKGETKVQTAKTDSIPDNMIAMIIPFEGINGLMGYIQGATNFLASKGYYLTIHTTKDIVEKENALLKTLPMNGVSGIILYPITDHYDLGTLYSLYMSDFPIVSIDKYFDGIPISSVVSDNFSGGYMAAQHLIECGHKKIAFVSSATTEEATTVRDRFLGYGKALKEAKIEFDRDICRVGFIDNLGDSTYEGFCTLMIQELMADGVTAIQTSNDVMAIQLIKNATKLGVKVPEELAIVGFDNISMPTYVDIKLTTIEQNFSEIGKQAAQLLVNWLERGEKPEDKVVVPVQLIERASTKKVK